MLKRSIYLPAVLLVLATLLGGCSTLSSVNSEVQAFSTQPSIAAGTRYRFEQLPSQVGNRRQSLLESHAATALEKAGLRRDDTAAQLSVLISEHISQENSGAWANPWPWAFWGSGHIGWGGRHGGIGVSFPIFPMAAQSPWYVREIKLTLRDLASQKVVYETRAVHDGVAAQNDIVLPAMFEAALKDFPNPPQGARRINIDLPQPAK